MVKAVIFDLDGTLLNTLGDLHASINHTMEHFGFPLHTLEEVKGYVGNGVVKLIQRACPENVGNGEEVLEYFKADYAVHGEDTTRPYDGIIELLEELKKRGIMCGIVSNKYDGALKRLDEKFFKGYFDVCIGERPEINKKPAPDMVYMALDALGITKDEAVYVGDSDVDIETAKNAGLKCISVTWGFRDRDLLTEKGACIFADTPLEVLKFI